MHIDKELSFIIDEYWEDFQNKKDLEFVVKPSIPIIWFGNMDSYLNSKTKIITIALNPSDKEFRRTNNEDFSLFRFPESNLIYDKSYLNVNDKKILCSSYNNYFTGDRSYKKWFRAYEKLLNQLDSSYYSNEYTNHSIHIDAYTGISTSLTWGQLTEEDKSTISNIPLFKKLLNFLNPDIVLISINIPAFNDIFNADNVDPDFSAVVNPDDGRSGYIRVYKKDFLLIHGKNRSLPFQGPGCTKSWKESVFKEIIKRYNLGSE
jgi:hypothetical protein